MRMPWIILAAVLPAAAHAADLAPGMWEISLEARAPAQSGFAPEPFRLNQCLTEADVRDPSALLGGYANPGASGCSYTDKRYSGNSFHFVMQCGGAYAIRAEGEARFSSDSMTATITSVASVGGEKASFTSKISARRLGGC